ncbi:MAG TPA: hypothetical protein VN428_01200 [Bryobacteraceae bacterium]|nr:hypothetical protein [Bryobacteraceae bacterium]
MRNPAVLFVLGVICLRGYAAEKPPAQIINVLVFDFASVPADILNRAMSESKRIVESAGVRFLWIDCPVAPERLASEESCRDAPGPLTLVLHVLPSQASRRQTEPAAFGFAVRPEDGGFGAYAGVFRDRVEQLRGPINKAALLGNVIAHEFGHLLLGTGQHSAGGIMKADWRHEHLTLAAQGRLQFDEADRGRIFGNVRRRTLAANSMPAEVPRATKLTGQH